MRVLHPREVFRSVDDDIFLAGVLIKKTAILSQRVRLLGCCMDPTTLSPKGQGGPDGDSFIYPVSTIKAPVVPMTIQRFSTHFGSQPCPLRPGLMTPSGLRKMYFVFIAGYVCEYKERSFRCQ